MMEVVYHISGGVCNCTVDAYSSAILGGEQNTVIGNHSAILGGSGNNDGGFNFTGIFGNGLVATVAPVFVK